MLRSQLKLLFVILVLFLTSSCNQGYREYEKDSFANYTWIKDAEISFYPDIENVKKNHSLTIGIRHILGLRDNSIPIQVEYTSPSGKKNTLKYNFNIRGSDGKYLADCAGDLCDLEIMVDKNLELSESGKYEFKVSHTNENSILGIMEVGIIIKPLE